MKVKKVIDECVNLLDVCCDKEDLLVCFNLVEYELALDYLPLYATHQCNYRVVYYTEFEYNPIRIVECNCKFKLYPTRIEGKEVITEVKYTYTPYQKDLYGECSYDEKYLNCLAYGTICEYLTSQGFYEEAIVWDKKYKKQIELLMV